MRNRLLGLSLAMLLVGCGKAPAPPAASPAPAAVSAAKSDGDAEQPSKTAKKRPTFRPVELEGPADAAATPSDRSGASPEADLQSVVAALQPFQVLLGKWRWGTRRKFGEFPRTGEDLEWVWDFQTDRSRPALSARSDAYPYLRKPALTWLPGEKLFQLSADDDQGVRRVLQGSWTDGGEPKEESDGKKLQRTYRLELTQVAPADGEQWQITFSQVDNNQYIVEIKRRPPTGKQFGALDSVRQQRVGTSFALADSDNPGPKCIISGGLGTMSVSYKGKSYPVCCSGCAAAFNDDPERWLAKLAGKKAE